MQQTVHLNAQQTLFVSMECKKADKFISQYMRELIEERMKKSGIYGEK